MMREFTFFENSIDVPAVLGKKKEIYSLRTGKFVSLFFTVGQIELLRSRIKCF